MIADGNWIADIDTEDAGYLGNSLLKKPGVAIEWDEEKVLEWERCSEDPEYFIEKYVKLIHVDRGLVPFEMYPYQKEIISNIHTERFNIILTARQAGKTSSLVGYILWFILFNDFSSVALLANKGETAGEVLGRIKLAYQYVPKWLQQGVIKWNERSIELENGSRVVAAATSSNSIRGYSFRLVVIDEAAHIDNWDQFRDSVYPTISSGSSTKLVLISTPNGLNHFYETWDRSEKGLNDYKRVFVNWKDVPGRDEEWKRSTLAAMNGDLDKFAQEYCLGFDSEVRLKINTQEMTVKLGNLGDVITRMDSVLADKGRRNEVRRNYGSRSTEKENVSAQERQGEVSQRFFDRDNSSVYRPLEDLASRKRGDREEEYLFPERTKSYENWEGMRSRLSEVLDSGLQVLRRVEAEDESLCEKENFSREGVWRVSLEVHENEGEVEKGLEVSRELSESRSEGVYDFQREVQESLRRDSERNSSSLRETESFHSSLQVQERKSEEPRDHIFSGESREVWNNVKADVQHLDWQENSIGALIHTPRGWRSFLGVQTRLVKPHLVTILSDGTKIVSSPGHPFIKFNREVVSSSLVDSWTLVFDPIGVEGEVYFHDGGVVSHNCGQFLGSSGTLISGAKLKELGIGTDPIQSDEGMRVYERPKPGRSYAVSVDTSEGKGLDFSTIQVIDVTEVPYRQVCTFRSNQLTTYDFATVVFRIASTYNEAVVLVESNDVGRETAIHLHEDLEYGNMIWTTSKGSKGKVIATSGDLGLRINPSTRTIGCAILKQLIEGDKLIIRDFPTINELSTFSRAKTKKKYEAEPGKHDDMVMPLVNFAWMSTQDYFRDITDISMREKIKEKTEEEVDESMSFFGFVDSGPPEEPEQVPVVDPSDRWF